MTNASCTFLWLKFQDPLINNSVQALLNCFIIANLHSYPPSVFMSLTTTKPLLIQPGLIKPDRKTHQTMQEDSPSQAERLIRPDRNSSSQREHSSSQAGRPIKPERKTYQTRQYDSSNQAGRLIKQGRMTLQVRQEDPLSHTGWLIKPHRKTH